MVITSDKWCNRIVQGSVIVVSLITAAMNARYGYSIGANEEEKWMLVAVGLAFDTIKFLGLRYVASAFLKGYWMKGALAGLGWLIVVAYSFNAAIGFAMTTRSHMNAAAEFELGKITKEETQVTSKVDHLKTLIAEFEKMKESPRYESTKACSVSKKRMSEESDFFCKKYWWKQTEILTAKKEAEAAEKGRVYDKEFRADPDPLMTFYSKYLNYPKETMITFWALIFAVMMETVSSVGNWAFSPSRLSSRKDKKEKLEEIEEEVQAPKKKRGRPLGSRNKPKLRVVN